MPKAHVFDWLGQPVAEAGCCVLYGGQWLLKQLARRHLLTAWQQEDELVTRFAADVEWRDVRDELSTFSLFSTGRRVVLVEDADEFVSKHRSELEEFVVAGSRSGSLVLEVASFPGNTRLHKAVAEHGVVVDCRPPEIERARGKPVVDTGRIATWLCERCEQAHGAKLQKAAAATLIELVGEDFGLLEQELAKLALYVPAGKSGTPELVRQVCGGWRKQTAWEMIDAAVEGRGADAIALLSSLLLAGEHPIALFGQLSWGLRRFGAAARHYEQARQRGESPQLGPSLTAAGFQPFKVKDAEAQLKSLGSKRALQLHKWLLEADLALKLTHSTPERGRLVLERLLLRLDAAAKEEARPVGPISSRTG